MGRRRLARIGGLVLALVVLVLLALALWEPIAAPDHRPPPERTYTAEIVRDAFGVPHIYGETDEDAAYGIAWAHAEDDFSTLQDVLAMARGRYGAIAGSEGAAVDYVYHLLGVRGTVAREYDKLPADTRALLDAYASGLNRFADAHEDEVRLARLFPVNGRDIAAGFALRQPFFFGLDNVIAPLAAGEDLRPERGPPIPSRTETPLPAAMGETADMAGSNAWAIAPEKSGDGVTRLVSNAHQPWRGGVAWYELVVESGEGWHFAGANFPGSPYPLLGHNEHLGWTNTVNRPDMIDVYRLELDESGTRYRFEGEWRDLSSRTVTLPVRFGPLTLPIRRTVHSSLHGPVIVNDGGAFAIRYGGIGRIGQLDAYYRLNKARDFDEWRSVLARMSIPSTNFIYADEAGNIGLFYNAALPARKPGADWRGILPGDRVDLVWRSYAVFDALPHVVNPASGWIYNANNTPFSAAGPGSDLDPGDYAPELGIEMGMTNRARRAARLMAEAETIDRATLERIKYDTGYDRTGYVALMYDRLNALDLSGEPDLARARDLLNGWDLDADGQGAADALALLVLREYVAFTYRNEEEPGARDNLRAAVDHLNDHFGRLDPPARDLLRLRQGTVDLPYDGGTDTLRAASRWEVQDDGRLAVVHGDSFVMFAEWAPGARVVSQSIQPFGSATTRPDSPHYADQAPLFVRHQLKPVHFWRADVLAHAQRRYTVSSRPASRAP